MKELNQKEFAQLITKVIGKENLTREETYNAFSVILKNETSEMQQGAFLAALAVKGETKEEIAGCWEAIYEFDTVKVTNNTSQLIVDNCGTGMDSYKTFNISTCASLIAATRGIPIARHGARALTSICGTVDIAEALGVDVECDPQLALKSLEQSNLALFNGMSPAIHPNALGRILSQISFGSILNIAASLANPIKPQLGVRGVYSKEMIRPVIEVMKEIGYKRAIVFNGHIENSQLTMDEASISGKTYCAELQSNGEIIEYSFQPENLGLKLQSPEKLKPATTISEECKSIIALIQGQENGARFGSVILNAGLIYYISGKANTIKEGVQQAEATAKSGLAYKTLISWIKNQNRNPELGLLKLQQINNN